MAYDFPLMFHPLLDTIIIHEEEFGFFDTLKSAINFCIDMTKVINHSVDLFYVTKYIGNEQIYHKNIIELIKGEI